MNLLENADVLHALQKTLPGLVGKISLTQVFHLTDLLMMYSRTKVAVSR